MGTPTLHDRALDRASPTLPNTAPPETGDPAPVRPAALPVVAANIPAELAAVAHWVGWDWRWQSARGEWAKVPLDARTGRHASVTNPATWSDLPAARAGMARGGWAGVGFVVTPAAGFVGVDLDRCRDPATGELAAWAAEVVAGFDSYAEVTPTGTGTRVWVAASLAGLLPDGKEGTRRGPVEVYGGGRYFTVTGHRLPGRPAAIRPAQSALDTFYAATFGNAGDGARPAEGLTSSAAVSDDDVLARCRAAANAPKFLQLWAGDTSGHGADDSAADLALLSLLSFWTQDPAQLDRLFRRSGLMRAKWDRADYRDRTIAKALDRRETHTPVGAAPRPILGGRPDAGTGTAPPWPVLNPAALHGLAGDVVRALDPHTEGDPAAVLVNLLVMVGSAVGGAPFVAVGEARHGANLFAVHVGATSKARKGTAHTDTLGTVRRADASWAGDRVAGGLSSGEGLVYPIRDPVETVKKGDTIVTDPGVTDKRLLVVEEEFSAVAKVAGREGNTLSEQLRKAWDGRTLGVMTRNSPLRATSPHVSVLAHVTKDELLRVFDSTDAANGFGNRFLWLCVRRSKLLPEGGRLPDAEAAALAVRVAAALADARRRNEVRRDTDATALWADVYGDLSSAKPGLLGALIARAEAHVLRLSLLYALLDHADDIGADHLLAALALWDYCEASARHIFGDATGDPIADRILAALRSTGAMAQDEVGNLFGRNVAAPRTGHALAALVAAGLVRSTREDTGGRPRTVWTAK